MVGHNATSFILSVVAIAGVGCAHNMANRNATTATPGLADVATSCKPSEALVVENRTGFPVKLYTMYPMDGTRSSSSLSSEALWTVQSGTVDTVGTVPKGRRVGYRVDRPDLPSGAPDRSDGLRSWCAAAG